MEPVGALYRNTGVCGRNDVDCDYTDSALSAAASPRYPCVFSDYAVLLPDRRSQKSACFRAVLRYLLAYFGGVDFFHLSAAHTGEQKCL